MEGYKMEKEVKASSTLIEDCEKLIPELFKSTEEMVTVPTSPSFFLSKKRNAEGFLTIGKLNHSGKEDIFILQRK